MFSKVYQRIASFYCQCLTGFAGYVQYQIETASLLGNQTYALYWEHGFSVNLLQLFK
jgi:hypothetical protein